MLRRQFNQSAAALSGLALTSPLAALAQSKPPADGAEYISLDQAVPTEGGPGKVDVVEFFWYSCPIAMRLSPCSKPG